MEPTEVETTKRIYQRPCCKHAWIPRPEGRAWICPNCRSVNWDVPEKESQKRMEIRRGLWGNRFFVKNYGTQVLKGD